MCIYCIYKYIMFICKDNTIEKHVREMYTPNTIKLGYTGVYSFYIDCGYTLEPPRRGGSNVYQQSIF